MIVNASTIETRGRVPPDGAKEPAAFSALQLVKRIVSVAAGVCWVALSSVCSVVFFPVTIALMIVGHVAEYTSGCLLPFSLVVYPFTVKKSSPPWQPLPGIPVGPAVEENILSPPSIEGPIASDVKENTQLPPVDKRPTLAGLRVGLPKEEPRKKIVELENGLQCASYSCVGDGNCLYRAIAHQLLGDQDEHGFVREALYGDTMRLLDCEGASEQTLADVEKLILQYTKGKYKNKDALFKIAYEKYKSKKNAHIAAQAAAPQNLATISSAGLEVKSASQELEQAIIDRVRQFPGMENFAKGGAEKQKAIERVIPNELSNLPEIYGRSICLFVHARHLRTSRVWAHENKIRLMMTHHGHHFMALRDGRTMLYFQNYSLRIPADDNVPFELDCITKPREIKVSSEAYANICNDWKALWEKLSAEGKLEGQFPEFPDFSAGGALPIPPAVAKEDQMTQWEAACQASTDPNVQGLVDELYAYQFALSECVRKIIVALNPLGIQFVGGNHWEALRLLPNQGQ
jgi:hypothetical protein